MSLSTILMPKGAYFSNVADELLRKVAEKNYWKNLTVNFIAKKPARI